MPNSRLISIDDLSPPRQREFSLVPGAGTGEAGVNGRAYYNELDPDAAAILRQLVADDVIAPGDVDERSIKDVRPGDLAGYTQCHFFAGGGLWSVAARLAGWPDDRPLWTGSCPCQPYSAAGKRAGNDDPRNLWPDFLRLIRGARAAGFGPPVIMGEQVSGSAGYGWFDGVRIGLAEENYASRARDIPACAVDAPHQRNRLWWIATADSGSGVRQADTEGQRGGGEQSERGSTGRAVAGRPDARHRGVTLGDTVRSGLEGFAGDGDRGAEGSQSHRPAPAPNGGRRNGSWWADAEWIVCHDGKARRTKSGLRFLVDGLPGRVGLWRVGGNAISPVLAVEVIRAFLETEGS